MEKAKIGRATDQSGDHGDTTYDVDRQDQRSEMAVVERKYVMQ